MKAVAVDTRDNIYVAGYYRDTLYLADSVYYSPYYTPLLVKLNPQLEIIWSISTAVTRHSKGHTISIMTV